jgi:S-adenosylmethionine:tRNA ribosyltransferase-isomerase
MLELPQPAWRGGQRVRSVLSRLARGEAEALISLSDFDYSLPEELIAQKPLEHRQDSRMLVVYRREQRWEDRRFVEFPEFLSAGDCLVLNNSRVIPSRLYGNRVGGIGRVEALLLRPVSADRRDWSALVRPGRRLPVGEAIEFGEGFRAEVIARGELGERTLRFAEGDVERQLQRFGHVPLPPYIKRADEPADRERYQTVFAEKSGSVAAPTAGLHFTPEILDSCRRTGAEIAYVTLHVGLGTFQPLHNDQLEGNRLHFEQYEITPENEARIRAASRRVAVGTTSVRTLESSMRSGTSGETDLFIYPGFEFALTNAMLTNFHLPRTSLLLLVCAFAGKDLTVAAYRHAVDQRYRFYSYGDCMLVV